MHVIFVRARSITGIITENISYLFRKFADPTRMFSSEIQLRFSEIYVSMSRTSTRLRVQYTRSYEYEYIPFQKESSTVMSITPGTQLQDHLESGAVALRGQAPCCLLSMKKVVRAQRITSFGRVYGEKLACVMVLVQ